MQKSRHKIVLYNPRAVFYTMPLALLAIGSELDPERFEVVIIDGRIDKNPEDAVRAAIDGAVCFGVTVLTGAPIEDAIAISSTVKAANPELPVIWGGWHPSMFGRDCLEEPAVDITVQAQGEETFSEIVERLLNDESLEGCAGCMYKTPDGSIHTNPPRQLRQLSDFREHNYELIDVEQYFVLKDKRQLDYISSQGCNFRCAFCSDPFVYGRKWTGIDPQRMATVLGELWRRYRFDDLNFQDETFFTKRERIRLMSEGIIDEGLRFSWAATMRADQGVRMPDDLWQLCKESGLRRLLVGVESGDPEMLRRIKKDVTIEKVFHTAERMSRLDIAGIFPFIVGFPGETPGSIDATIECAKRLRKMSARFETPIFYFKPYPGSEIVTQAVADGYQLPSTLAEWSQFDYVAGLPGPWVTQDKYQLIERFKFFLDLAWGENSKALLPFRQLARLRCDRVDFRLPVEKALLQRLLPAEKLS